VDVDTSAKSVKLASRESKVYSAVGVHPNSSGTWDENSLGKLKVLARGIKTVAIGEIGLDYYRDRAPRKLQRNVFLKQLDLAKELGFPVIIHTRNSSNQDRRCIRDVIGILQDWNHKIEYPGVVHSYSGDHGEAEKLVSLGFFLGITGPITYKKAILLKDVVASLPIQNLLLETDGPYLTPHPFRGKRNEPAYVRYVAEEISRIKSQPIENVLRETAINADNLFGWGITD
jgi:TatD DNase family protein